LRRVALKSTDPLVAGNAVRALGRLKMVAGDEELVGLLIDERPRVRQEIIVALGKSGWRASVPRLARLVRDDDRTVRLLAIQAIRELGGREADAILREVRNRADATEAERAFARSAPS
jgi:HEAT repeat protein